MKISAVAVGPPCSIICTLVISFFVPAANADDNTYRFQLTPFVGYRFGGTFEDSNTQREFEIIDDRSFGLELNFPSRGNTEWEIYYSKQSSEVDTVGFVSDGSAIDVDIEYLQIGGTYLFEETSVALPFIVATIGGTKISPEGLNSKSDMFFAFGIGGGWKYFPSRRLGLRLDGRVHGTFVDSDSRIFCQTGFNGGSCIISTSGNLLYQFELQAGLVFRF